MLDGGTWGPLVFPWEELGRERPGGLAGCPGVVGQQKLRGEALVGEEQPEGPRGSSGLGGGGGRRRKVRPRHQVTLR